MTGSLLAAVEERFLVGAYASPRSKVWISAHGALALPFQLYGEARPSTVTTPEGVVRVVEIGRRKRTEPHCGRLLGCPPAGGEGGRRTLWSPALLAGLECDLAVAEIHRWMAPRFRRSGWIIVPDAVRWQGDLHRLPPPAATPSLKADLSKLRKYGYTLERATTAEEWDEFYRSMVLPQAHARFGREAWIPSPRLRRGLAARGVLHFIRRDGQRVAGICSVLEGEKLWLPVMGLRQGDERLRKEGVTSAIFALIFEWARLQGCRRVDAGRTSPFILEGGHRFKRKWGLEPVADPLTHLLAVRVGPAAKPCFVREPLLVEAGDRLERYPVGG